MQKERAGLFNFTVCLGPHVHGCVQVALRAPQGLWQGAAVRHQDFYSYLHRHDGYTHLLLACLVLDVPQSPSCIPENASVEAHGVPGEQTSVQNIGITKA